MWSGFEVPTIPESCGCDFLILLSLDKNILLDAALSKDIQNSSKYTIRFLFQNPLILLSIFTHRPTSLASFPPIWLVGATDGELDFW